MSKQLSDFITYVLNDFKRDDKNTELIQAYNDIIKLVASKNPNEGYKYQSWVPTVVQREDYPLPPDCNHLIHPVKLLEGSASTDSGYPMNHISKQEYDARYPNPNRTDPDITGKPVDYSIFAREILVGPLPDSASYLIEIDWAKFPPDLSGDSDLHSLGSNWDLVLKWGTLWLLYEGIGLMEEAERFRQLFIDKENGYPAKIDEDAKGTRVSRHIRPRYF